VDLPNKIVWRIGLRAARLAQRLSTVFSTVNPKMAGVKPKRFEAAQRPVKKPCVEACKDGKSGRSGAETGRLDRRVFS
jgi:hypothetical protein